MNNLEKILATEKLKQPIKAKKSIKRIISDFMTILTVISIFVFSIFCIGFIIFTLISSPASAENERTEKSPAEKFQEAVQYVNSFKDVIQTEKTKEGNLNLKVNSFKLEPEKVFNDPKTQKNWYTDTPAQANYYGDSTQSNVNGMGKDARTEIAKDENYKDADGKPIPAPGKAVAESFRTRPIFKVSKNEEYVKKSRLVEANASNIITGESNKHIDCKNKKLSTCKIIQVEKNCNEEVRTIQKICEKVPKITTHINEIVCPNCQSLIITQHLNNHCPSGYGELLYADMVQTSGNHWDDIRFCTRGLSVSEGLECFTGGYIVTSNRDNRDSGRVTVPKKLHARIRMSNVYFDYIIGTIINETTGQTLYSNAHFGNGQVIDLSYSDTQDQTFRFYAVQPPDTGHRWFRDQDHRPGVMVLYVDHINREKVADITWPDTEPEAFCYEK